MRMGMHFTLGHRAPFVGVNDLDGVFDRDNVFVPGFVEVIDHGPQSRGLATAGRSGDKHESLAIGQQPFDNRRHSQLGQRGDFSRQGAKDASQPEPLPEDVRTEAAYVGHFIAEVHAQALG